MAQAPLLDWTYLPKGQILRVHSLHSDRDGRAPRGVLLGGCLNGVQGDGDALDDAHGGEGVALAVQALVALVVLLLAW